eukprot:COSAG05_NODE_20302_length_280_cov_1.193370_1_plen_57_part_01
MSTIVYEAGGHCEASLSPQAVDLLLEIWLNRDVEIDSLDYVRIDEIMHFDLPVLKCG